MKLLKKKLFRYACLFMLALTLLGNSEALVYAKNTDASAFEHLTWEKILEQSVETKNGVVQSICATDQYIICLENSGDSSSEKDIAYAFYRNPWDENGNPVEQYSLAFKNKNWDWEHCNGMCYNPDRDEIYVALYTNNDPASRGCVYVMDPHTLDRKTDAYDNGRIHIADSYNILGIGYFPDQGRYMIQANAEGDYAIKILDGDFNLLADSGPGDLGLGSNSQDLCVCGDYIMNFPLTFDREGLGNYMNVYEIDSGRSDSQNDYPITIKKLFNDVKMDLETDGNKKVEPESICEVDDGEFFVTVNIMTTGKKRRFAWYRTKLDSYNYSIKTECINGTISSQDEANKVAAGGSYTVQYKPDPGYVLRSILIDGNQQLDPAEYPREYTFTDVTADHSIRVEYAEKAVAVSPQDTGTSQGNHLPVPEKKSHWKIILIILCLILMMAAGIWRYVQHVRIERKKRTLRRKIQREKERIARQKIQEETENLPDIVSIEELRELMQEFETAEKPPERAGKKTVKKKKKTHSRKE